MFGHPPLSHESRVSDSDPAQNIYELPEMLTYPGPFSQAPASRLSLTRFLQALATWSG